MSVATVARIRLLTTARETSPSTGRPVAIEALAARWLALGTDVDTPTGRSLSDSMSNEVVVRDDSIRDLVPFDPVGYDAAVLTALGERAAAARA